jgi:hypothetical protein
MYSCPICGVQIGMFHKPGCISETCSRCGKGTASCKCAEQKRKIPWSGDIEGTAQCRELGYYAKIVFLNGKKAKYYWKPCHKGESGASFDLERLYKECKWNAEMARWEPLICKKTAM